MNNDFVSQCDIEALFEQAAETLRFLRNYIFKEQLAKPQKPSYGVSSLKNSLFVKSDIS